MNRFVLLTLSLFFSASLSYADQQSVAHEAMSRLVSIVGMVSPLRDPLILSGVTPNRSSCKIGITYLTLDSDEPLQLGIIDITMVSGNQRVDFRSTSGQISGPGVTPYGVLISTRHQDGMTSNNIITQTLEVHAAGTAGHLIGMKITDASRGTLTCLTK